MNIKNLFCIILCGGSGTRLKDLTQNHQKCMIEINGKPFLSYIISQLKSFGIRNFIFATGKFSEEVELYFSDLGIISKEEEPLGTGGAIKNAIKFVNNNHFLVVNGDSYCNISKDKFNLFIQTYDGNPLLLVTHIKDSILSSRFETDIYKHYGAGFYLFPKYLFETIPNICSLEHDILPKFINKNYFFLNETLLIDIGVKENLEKAKEILR